VDAGGTSWVGGSIEKKERVQPKSPSHVYGRHRGGSKKKKKRREVGGVDYRQTEPNDKTIYFTVGTEEGELREPTAAGKKKKGTEKYDALAPPSNQEHGRLRGKKRLGEGTTSFGSRESRGEALPPARPAKKQEIMPSSNNPSTSPKETQGGGNVNGLKDGLRNRPLCKKIRSQQNRL